MLADPRFLWTEFVLALPVLIATHLLVNLLFDAYGSRAGQMVVVVVAGLTAGVFLLLINYVARAVGFVLPYSVIAIGAVLTVVGMSLARFAQRRHAPG